MNRSIHFLASNFVNAQFHSVQVEVDGGVACFRQPAEREVDSCSADFAAWSTIHCFNAYGFGVCIFHYCGEATHLAERGEN